ncbi:MAG: DUF2268 domain-containing putative Zn-dependent protease [Candidatus Nanohaloarchaea archaeon]
MERINYCIKTGKKDLEKAEKKVVEGLERVSSELPKDDDLDIDLGWTSQDFVVENMNGTTGKCINSEWIEIKFNSNGENWEKNLVSTVVHEYTHSWFYEEIGHRAKTMWLYILDEALTQHFSKKLVPEASHEKSTKFSREEISEYWSKIKEEQVDRKDSKISRPLFVNRGDSEYPNWLGYSLAYQIGKELLKNHRPEEFTELGKQDVIRAGDKLFIS